MLLALLIVLVVAAVVAAVAGRRQVPTGHLGLVYRRIGRSHPDDRFAVRAHGSPGPQAATLAADRVYLRPFPIYRVSYVPQTYVPPGTIGVVVARAGAAPPVDRALCRHVECDHFQDGRAFLANGGQQGRQPGILRGGASYDVNPWLFEVITVDNIGDGRYDLTAEDLREITVPEGSTGVVIALEGEPPDDEDDAVGRRVPGHQSFQRPWVFLDNGGQRGAQAETLSHGGVYAINPWFARIALMPTRDLILEWSRKEYKPRSNFDAALDEIVINVEGHRLHFDMSQTIRIPAKAAPRLVGRFGEQEGDMFGASGAGNPAPVQRFVERVLGRTVEGYFQSTAADYHVLDFLAHHNEVRLELEERVRAALAEWDVEAVRTTLNDFEPEDTDIDAQRRQIARERDRRRFLEQRAGNVEIEARIEEVLTEVERQRGKIAAAELEERIRLLGRDSVALERFLEQLAKMNVPEFVGSDPNTLLHLPLPVAQNMINKYLAAAGRDAEPSDQQRLAAADNAALDGESPPEEPTDGAPPATPVGR